jgi:ubiquinone/menaquinone biosynthesis C-methylase UbiE
MPRKRQAVGQTADTHVEGWQGWDQYAAFYDWENARTMGRRDVHFWRDLAGKMGGRVLELGCGTGRVTLPMAQAGISLVGVDRSAAMLALARRRVRRKRLSGSVSLVRGDIRMLPFGPERFDLVMAPYGVLQSLVREADLKAALTSVAGLLAPGGTFGLDLVQDLTTWAEYQRRVRFRGTRRSGQARLTLVESVRQHPRQRLTVFDQEYIEQRGATRRRRKFSLLFRTLSVAQITRRLQCAGFRIAALFGDYDGKPWDRQADVSLILAERK